MSDDERIPSTRESPTDNRRCPICKAEVVLANESAPFCSPRCRKVDLGRWFNEGYKISRPIEQQDLDEP